MTDTTLYRYFLFTIVILFSRFKNILESYYKRSIKFLVMTAKINLPDIDDKYRRSYSAVHKQHELRKELLIDQDYRECGRQVQQVMYEETEYS